MNWWIAKLSELEEQAYGSLILWRKRPWHGGLRVRYVTHGTAGLFSAIWTALFIYILVAIIRHG
jgi:hypothetical protein